LFFPPWRGVVGAVLEGGVALALLAWAAFATVVLLETAGDERNATGATGAAVRFGAICGLAILARLDNVWVIGCLCLLVLSRGVSGRDRRALDVKAVALAVGIPIALLTAYVASNMVFFHHPLPISGYIKTSFPHIAFSRSYLRSYLAYYGLLLAGYVGTGLALRMRSPVAPTLAALSVGGTMQGLYVLLFSPHGVYWWHFVSLLPGGLLAFAVILDAASAALGDASRAWWQSLAAITAGVVLAGAIVSSLVGRSADGVHYANSGWRIEAERAATWANRQVPRGAMLAMRDSGGFGYYANDPVMNLDGVMSSYGYYRDLCAGRALDQMRAAGVRYVAYHNLSVRPYRQFILGLSCFRNGHATALRFTPADEVYSGRRYWAGRYVRFVIWRFDPQVQQSRAQPT
jgi:hypothetical protein